ncbi:MAG: hypothetical protein R3A44_06265 [Caldilineaceae bacterium]
MAMFPAFIVSYFPYGKEVISIAPQLEYAVFDWKDIDGLVSFLETATEDGPFCFRHAETEDDCVVVVFGPSPIRQEDANAFYQTIVDSEQT